MQALSLPGCIPEPLMSYLKALGILRLVSEQKESKVRGCWREGAFALLTALDAEALIAFFRDAYAPTSVFSPWNGDGGFLSESGTSFETRQRAANSSDPRLARLKPIIEQVQAIDSLAVFSRARQRAKVLDKKTKAKNINVAEADEIKRLGPEIKALKEGIIFQIRNQFPEEGLDWLDACLLISTDGFSVAPVLGSGGVDGRLEFSSNFLANVLLVLKDEQSTDWLRQSLFGATGVPLVETSIGQFAPGRIGGPNGTQGMEGRSLVNPWDFVLMIEGSLFLAGSVARKLSVSSRGRASFPFTVAPSAAGNGALSGTDSNSARGEIWLPLWERWTSTAELKTLFAEGRAELRGRQSRDGVDFARAVASLGVDRGISAFTRQGFLQRNGLAFLATPLGRFPVQGRPHMDLLHREVDRWLESFRLACSDKMPARYLSALRGVERAIFDYCRYGGGAFLQQILVALGEAERVTAGSEGFRTDRQTGRVKIQPLAGLSANWLAAVADNTPEFRLALALAGIQDSNQQLEKNIGPLRVNLEPVKSRKGRFGGFEWDNSSRSAVWNGVNLADDLLAVFLRRQMDHARMEGKGSAFMSRNPTPLVAVAHFLAGDTDDDRIAALLTALILIAPAQTLLSLTPLPKLVDAPSLPRAYTLLKLLFLPYPIELPDGSRVRIPGESAILPLLRAGRVPEACRIAMRRLRATGLRPLPHRVGGGRNRDDDWDDVNDLDGVRLAAALLFPVSALDITHFLVPIALRTPDRNEDSTFTAKKNSTPTTAAL